MYFTFISRILLAFTASIYIIEKTTKINIFKFINKTVLFIIYLILALAIVYNIFDRDFYLPFLGPSVIPIKQIDLENDKMITIDLENLPKNKRIIYWGANPTSNSVVFKDPLIAYSGYGNSGVTKTNEKGKARIQIHCPSKYNIPRKMGSKKDLEKHIHYRIETDYEGLFGKVQTYYVNC
jgi:hypothetical protein